ncbi:amine oxidase [flavin-containing] B-like isoform X2 [Ptychodera flava]|uniref:amine oxidase [flavin-containing] B-like isoform X2 n=1 Tax=Ptychodera flava TaxID=63121 RepID=UPI00396A9278
MGSMKAMEAGQEAYSKSMIRLNAWAEELVKEELRKCLQSEDLRQYAVNLDLEDDELSEEYDQTGIMEDPLINEIEDSHVPVQEQTKYGDRVLSLTELEAWADSLVKDEIENFFLYEKDKMSRRLKKDVIVIGAGISGMSAAKLLHEAGLDVLVLEARDRPGGRSVTYRDSRYGCADMGAAFVGPTQNRILRLLKELGIETSRVNFDDGKTVMLLDGSRYSFEGEIPNLYNPIIALDLNHLQVTIQNEVEKLPLSSPWDAPFAKEYDNMTVAEWFDKICYTESSRRLGRIVTNSAFCVEPEQISLLYFLWDLKVGGGLKRMVSVENGAQERYILGGSQQVSEKIADLIGSEKVIFNSVVTSVTQNDGVVKVSTNDGRDFMADYIVLAIPPIKVTEIAFQPVLPFEKDTMLQEIYMKKCVGAGYKLFAFYDRPFWRERGLNGNTISDSLVHVTFDGTKSDGSYPSLMGLIAGDNARLLSSLSAEDRKKRVCEHFAKILECEEALYPIDYVEYNWMEDEYSKGCIGMMPIGSLVKYGRYIRESHGRVFFAGTETATKWRGYMDGAVQAGERAAREALHAMGRISEDEIWQEEPESEEVPALPCEYSTLERMLPSVPGFFQFLASSVIVLLAIGIAGMFRDSL